MKLNSMLLISLALCLSAQGFAFAGDVGKSPNPSISSAILASPLRVSLRSMQVAPPGQLVPPSRSVPPHTSAAHGGALSAPRLWAFSNVSLLKSSFTGAMASADEESNEPVSKGESRKTRAARLMNMTGDAEFADDRLGWDKTYNRKDYVFGKEPVSFLSRNVDKLPKGRALDIAMGEGRNAVYLAKKGFLVEGVDISSVGIKKAQKLAAENGVKLSAINADLNKYRIRPGSYSVILNFYYLQRSLFPQIIAGLKKGGVVVYESYTTEQLKNPGSGDFERDMLLAPGELRQAFSELEILHYSETNDGKTAVASLIARKR